MASPSATAGNRGSVWRFGDCELHVPTRELWHRGQQQAVRRRVFDLIVHLVERRPGIVAHADIARAVWGRPDVRPSLLAQAIMQARQAIGDDGDSPAMLLTVRGAGYRFAASVTEGPQAPTGDETASAAAAIRAILADAEAAVEARDEERAMFLADRALALATDSGINSERSRVLTFSARVAIRRGTLEHGAALATQALRLAEQEGNLEAAALARAALGRIRSSCGDLHGALSHLHAAHSQLNTPELLPDRLRCEWYIALAERELGRYDVAMDWCARANATTRELAPGGAALPEMSFDVSTQLMRARDLLDQGQPDEARAHFEQALALNHAYEHAVPANPDPGALLCWLGNQAAALNGLGRLAEAWHAADALGREMANWREKSGSQYQRWQSSYLCLQAQLLADSRRFPEAVAAAQQALDVARDAGQWVDLPSLLLQAVRVHEAAGQLQAALDLSRQKQALLAQQQSERAVALASVLQAEAQADTLRRDLDSARQQARQLALENRSLMQRLSALEHSSALDDAGFSDPLVLRSLLAHRHADARQRDVPFCLALLCLDNLPSLAAQHSALTIQQLLRELARRLADVLPAATPVLRWQPGQFVFALEDMGARRAAAICQQLQDQLQATPWLQGMAGGPALVPKFSARSADAAVDDTLESTLRRLQASA